MDAAYVKTFVVGLAEFSSKLSASYEGDHEKPVILPPMDVTLPPRPFGVAKKITVQLRSIRVPKFNTTYEVLDSDCVFAVKERLLSDPQGPLKDVHYAVSSVRFMLKANAISDVRQLRELPSTEFTVMFVKGAAETPQVVGHAYWSDHVPAPVPAPREPEENAARVPAPDAADEMADDPEDDVDAPFWADINAVLRRHNRTHLLPKFKNC